MGTEVRRAVPGDVEPLLDLVAESCAATGEAFDAVAVRAGLDPLLADDGLGTVWMIDGRDGFAVVLWEWSVERGGFDAVLDEIYVRTRGDGRGGDALREIEADCRRRGIARVHLETERDNDDARRLYERLGYGIDDTIAMSKELT